MIKVIYRGDKAVKLPCDGKLYRFMPNEPYRVPKAVQRRFASVLEPVEVEKPKQTPKKKDKDEVKE